MCVCIWRSSNIIILVLIWLRNEFRQLGDYISWIHADCNLPLARSGSSGWTLQRLFWTWGADEPSGPTIRHKDRHWNICQRIPTGQTRPECMCCCIYPQCSLICLSLSSFPIVLLTQSESCFNTAHWCSYEMHDDLWGPRVDELLHHPSPFFPSVKGFKTLARNWCREITQGRILNQELWSTKP